MGPYFNKHQWLETKTGNYTTLVNSIEKYVKELERWRLVQMKDVDVEHDNRIIKGTSMYLGMTCLSVHWPPISCSHEGGGNLIPTCGRWTIN